MPAGPPLGHYGHLIGGAGGARSAPVSGPYPNPAITRQCRGSGPLRRRPLAEQGTCRGLFLRNPPAFRARAGQSFGLTGKYSSRTFRATLLEGLPQHTIGEPPAESSGRQQLMPTQVARYSVPDVCEHVRPSLEGDEPPSRGCPLGHYSTTATPGAGYCPDIWERHPQARASHTGGIFFGVISSSYLKF